jgi:LemA protein
MIAVLLVVAVVVVLGGAAWWAYNGMVQSRNACDAGWAQVQVQLTRRHDLLPNLIETVKGYASHERLTLDAVVAARTTAIASADSGSPVRQAAAENMLTGALKGLFALAEAYPDLKANANFASLQTELAATEDRVAFARQFFNDAVLRYNTQIQTVPRNVLAGPLHFEAREFFDADPGATAPIAVQF